MVEKNGLWNKTPKIFVAFLDIMGFKDKVLREKHEDVKKMLESLVPAIKDIEKSKQVYYAELKKSTNTDMKVDNSSSSLTYPVTFSDSIILFSKDKTDDSAVEIIVSAARIISEALKREIPMKGAIAFGEMTVDTNNSLYFGQPLIDAYELHKEIKLYGVVLHHTAQRQINELTMARTLSSIFALSYSVPMNSGEIEHNLVNWIIHTPNSIDVVRKLYNNVSGTSRIYVDNTIKFVNDYQTWMKKNQDKAIQNGIIKKTKR